MLLCCKIKILLVFCKPSGKSWKMGATTLNMTTWHHALCRISFIVMLNVEMLCVSMLCVDMLSVIMLSVVILNVIMLNVLAPENAP